MEEYDMSRKVEDKMSTARKWLDRNSGIGTTIKPATAALTAVDKAIAEAKSARAKYSAAVAAKEKAIKAMNIAMTKARLEKKLKAKESKLQAKLASLAETDKQEKA